MEVSGYSYRKPETVHSKAIVTICSKGWKQTVEGKLSEEYQRKNVDYWYNKERVENDIKEGFYSYITLLNSEVVGVIGGGKTKSNVGEIYVLYVDENIRYKGIGKNYLKN